MKDRFTSCLFMNILLMVIFPCASSLLRLFTDTQKFDNRDLKYFNWNHHENRILMSGKLKSYESNQALRL